MCECQERSGAYRSGFGHRRPQMNASEAKGRSSPGVRPWSSLATATSSPSRDYVGPREPLSDTVYLRDVATLARVTG
jgi:hypothetical protein